MAFVPIVPIAVAARQRRILRKFEEAGASDAARARTPAELDIRDSHLFGRLVKAGVLVGVGEGRYYVCAEGRKRWRQRRRIRVLTAIGLVVVGMLVALALGVFGR